MSTQRVDMADLDFGGITVLYEGDLFTGIAYENWPDGTVHLEQPYENGVPAGARRRYAASDRLIEEVLFHEGQAHGIARWWSDAGRLVREMLYQYGVAVERKDFDGAGNVVSEWRIDPDDGQAAYVRKRQQHDQQR